MVNGRIKQNSSQSQGSGFIHLDKQNSHSLLRLLLSVVEVDRRKASAMGYIEHLATVYPPRYYQCALLGVIGISGLAKVLPVVQRWLHGWLPFLPTWTWTRVAVWELVFVAVYLLLGWKVFAINMSFMLVGGALWVTTFQSKRIPSSSSLLRKTSGLALIPVRPRSSDSKRPTASFTCRLWSMDTYSRSVSVS